MATSYSFDIASEVDLQEIDNALNQAKKEIDHRFDLRGSNAVIDIDPKQKTISIRADGDHFFDSIGEILRQKCFKRGISALSLDFGKTENFGGRTLRQTVKIKDGLEQDEAKKITQTLRDAKLKVNASIQGNQVRVTGKSKDELQECMTLLRNTEFHFPIQFINMR